MRFANALVGASPLAHHTQEFVGAHGTLFLVLHCFCRFAAGAVNGGEEKNTLVGPSLAGRGLCICEIIVYLLLWSGAVEWHAPV